MVYGGIQLGLGLFYFILLISSFVLAPPPLLAFGFTAGGDITSTGSGSECVLDNTL